MAIQNYLLYNYSLLSLTGMCRIKSRSTPEKYLLYLWRIIVNLNLLYFCVSTLIYAKLENADDFQDWFLSCIYFGASLMSWIRLSYFYVFDELTETVYNEMRRFFKYETHTGLENKNLHESISLVKMMTNMWIAGGSTGSICVLLAVLYFGKYSERKLPFGVWYPFDWQDFPYYQLTIGFQGVVMMAMAFSVIAVDMFFACCVILTSAQFEFLGLELKCLVQTVLLKNGMGEFLDQTSFAAQERSRSSESKIEDFSLNDIDAIVSSEQFRRDLLASLNKQIEFHQSLIKFCKLLDDLYSPIYLPYVIFGVGTTVFMAFNITAFQRADIGVMITSGFTLTLMVVTLLWPCYLGQVLLTQTEDLFDDMYSSLWYLCDEKFKASLKIMCSVSFRPIRLTLGKFSYLSLETYLTIINSVMSYVIFLHQMTGSTQQYTE